MYFQVIGPDNRNTMEVYAGLSSEQFERVLRTVLPSLLQKYKTEETSRLALYMYLMKLRTNQPYSQMAPHFNTSARTVSRWIRIVREIVHKEFVPLHLFTRTQEDILRHTTPLSQKLFKTNKDSLILVWDGTYIFTIKSSNYDFQKKTYSMQKQRNLIKVMMCVSTDGLIVGMYGPYDAKRNDASILNELMDTHGNIFENLRPNDLMVVDRGFRDSERKLKQRNFRVGIPEFITSSSSQLSTKQANASRIVTKTRFIVEVRNGHIKSKWKYFNSVKNVESIPYLMKDYQVCVALLNSFCVSVRSDKDDWDLIGNTMLSRLNMKNELSMLVSKIPISLFTSMNNLTLFPKLKIEELKEITQGTYQIAQSRSYCQMHLKENRNDFVINVLNENECRKFCEKLITANSSPLLLLTKFKSRYVASKHHKSYVLIDLNATGKAKVLSYCCSCKNGLRTIGCCSHVTTILWYTYYIERTNIRLPSQNLNNYFDLLSDADTDSNADSEMVSDSDSNSN